MKRHGELLGAIEREGYVKVWRLGIPPYGIVGTLPQALEHLNALQDLIYLQGDTHA